VASSRQPSLQPESQSRRSPELLLRGVLPTAIPPAAISILRLTRAPTARHLADNHIARRCLDSDAHKSSYCAASCQQPSHQPTSRRSPEPLLRGVLPTTISPDGVSMPTLTRAPTALRLANSHLTSRRPDAHQSSYYAASCRQPSHQLASRPQCSSELGR